jgi:hypothetical protein
VEGRFERFTEGDDSVSSDFFLRLRLRGFFTKFVSSVSWVGSEVGSEVASEEVASEEVTSEERAVMVVGTGGFVVVGALEEALEEEEEEDEDEEEDDISLAGSYLSKSALMF